MILLKIKDIIRPKISEHCSIMELFGFVNLDAFKWFFHCDYEVLIRDNGKIPKLSDREEKRLFVKTLAILLEEFDDYMLDNVRGICRKILPKAEFCNFYSKSGVLFDDIPSQSRLRLELIDYSFFMQKKQDFTYSENKKMIVEFND